MTSRTPNISRLAMRQIPRLERAVRRLDHPCQGGFIALLNAIDWQAEIGRGDPECIHHLGLAILAFARSLGIDPDSTGIAPAVAPLLQQLSGKSFTPVTSYCPSKRADATKSIANNFPTTWASTAGDHKQIVRAVIEARCGVLALSQRAHGLTEKRELAGSEE